MKKLLVGLILGSILALVFPFKAVNASSATTEDQVPEQERVQAQEQEQEQEQNREMEQEMGQGQDNESSVSARVNQLLQIGAQGGIGNQVREIAKLQNEEETQTKEEVGKLDSRQGIAKFFLGPDYSVLKTLNAQVEQNQNRINQLQQLKTQLANKADETALQQAIAVMTAQNTALQERITAEEDSPSVFGWLIKLFAR